MYLDYAATTPVKPEVAETIYKYMIGNYYNPSSLYEGGLEAKRDIENARKIIADSIGAKPDEVFFTASGSESNNWAMKANESRIIVSPETEHASIYYCMTRYDYILNVNKYGLVDLIDLKEKCEYLNNHEFKPFVSIMMVNNETGLYNLLWNFSSIVHDYNGILHVDATQAYGHMKIDVDDFGIDMMTITGHKIGCPKGIAALYVRGGASKIKPMIDGGGQERDVRAGTENTPYIIGFAKAVELLPTQDENLELYRWKDGFIDKLLTIPDSEMTLGKYAKSITLGNIISIRFNGVNNEELQQLLDENGYQVSTGSACSSGEHRPSRVLKAMGLTDEQCKSTIRISVDEPLSDEEVDAFVDTLGKLVKMLREKK